VLGEDDRHATGCRRRESIDAEAHGLLDEERVPFAQAMHLRCVALKADARQPARCLALIEAP
jgi:hypothetical protein